MKNLRKLLKDWDELQNKVQAWAQSTFSEITPDGTSSKFLDEAHELRNNPADIDEHADCIILQMQIAANNGFTMSDILEQVEKKFEKNRARKWRYLGGGKYQHVKE